MMANTSEMIKMALKADVSIDRNEQHRLIQCLSGAPIKSDKARLLRRREVAERLSVSLRTVDNLARDGSLQRIKLPGRSRSVGFRESDVAGLMGLGPDNPRHGC